MTPPPDLPKVTIASLLADVPRFQARAAGSGKVDEGEFHNWLQNVGLDETAGDIETFKFIIDESRSLALGGLGAEEKRENLSRPLVNVFSKVSFGEGYHNYWSYLPPSKVGSSPTFPSNDVIEASPESYRSLWEGFTKEMKGLTNPSPDAILLTLEKYTSFIPYCPGREEDLLSDIPFFDQVKVAAAIASSLYYAMSEKGEDISDEGLVKDISAQRYLLVGGDFSGVQSFIYNISSKGALKELRGRSFFLEFFTEHVIYEILAPLGLSRANVIFSGGSRFNLLVPNCESVTNHLMNVRGKINRYLWEEHDARLYLALEWVELSGSQLKVPEEKAALPSRPTPLAEQFRMLAANISRSKHAKFTDYLDTMLEPRIVLNREMEKEVGRRLVKSAQKYEGKCPRCGNAQAAKWQFALRRGVVEGCQICLDPSKISFDECEVCHKEDFLFPLPYPSDRIVIEQVPSACQSCCDLFHIGEHLSSGKYIVRVAQGREGEKLALTIGDADYVFLERERQEIFRNATAIWVINDLDNRLYKEGKAYPFFVAVYPTIKEVAMEGEEHKPDKVPTEFEALAKRSTGVKRIGALRMDVDNLGEIATGRGFPKREEKNSLSRVAVVSRCLTNFFKAYMGEFCRGTGLPSPQTHVVAGDQSRDKNRKVIIIYSGGDDLFVVGAWSDVAELTFDLYHCFRRYTGGNPDVTLSAGMVVREHSYPLHHLAEDAQKAEHAAKENKEGENGKKKDSVALFFPSLLFAPEAQRAPLSGSDLAERLVDILEKEGLKRALKWEDGVFPMPSGLNLLELTKWLARELGDGEKNNVLQLKAGSRALIYKLFNVVERRRTEGKLFLPLLFYTLGSRVAESKLSTELEHCLLDTKTVSYLHPALTWVDLLSREK